MDAGQRENEVEKKGTTGFLTRNCGSSSQGVKCLLSAQSIFDCVLGA